MQINPCGLEQPAVKLKELKRETGKTIQDMELSNEKRYLLTRGIGMAVAVAVLLVIATNPASVGPPAAQAVSQKNGGTVAVSGSRLLPTSPKTAAYRPPAHTGPAPVVVEFPRQTENTIVVARTPQLVKQDAYRNPLPENAGKWDCVADKTTGLVWEVKTNDKGLQDAGNYYSWYRADGEITPGNTAPKSAGSCRGGISCDTESYINAINKKKVCGYSDWRLPTRKELLSLVQIRFSEDHRTMINTRFFPNTAGDWFWTSDTDADDAAHAWYVLFYNGRTMKAPKHQAKRVRLVRGDPGPLNFRNVAGKGRVFANEQLEPRSGSDS